MAELRVSGESQDGFKDSRMFVISEGTLNGSSGICNPAFKDQTETSDSQSYAASDRTTSATGGVDAVLVELCQFGRWQMTQYLVLSLRYISSVFNLMSIVFIGYRPDFWCASLNGTDGQVNQCDVWNNTTNTSETCHSGFIYDLHTTDVSIAAEWGLVCDRAFLAEMSQTLLYIGLALGSSIFTPLSDKFGRKKIYLFGEGFVMVLALATAFAPNIVVFSILRLLTGLFLIGGIQAAYVLSVEVFPVAWRTEVGIGTGFFWAGSLILYSGVAYGMRDLAWWIQQLVTASTSIVLFIPVFTLDESIRWLLDNGRLSEALIVIKKAAKINKVSFENVLAYVPGVSAEREHGLPPTESTAGGGSCVHYASENLLPVESDKSPDSTTPKFRHNILMICRHRKLRTITLIMCWTWMVNTLTYYGLYLMSATLTDDRYLAFLNSIVEIPANITSLIVTKKFGRRRTVIVLHLLCGLTLLLAAILQTVDEVKFHLGSVILFVTAKFWITATFSAVVVFTPELFPTNIRGSGYGLVSGASRIGSMLSPYFGLLSKRVRWAPASIFAFSCLLVSIFTTCLPETGNQELPRTVEDMERWDETRDDKRNHTNS